MSKYCPECGSANIGKKCNCGWIAKVETTTDRKCCNGGCTKFGIHPVELIDRRGLLCTDCWDQFTQLRPRLKSWQDKMMEDALNNYEGKSIEH